MEYGWAVRRPQFPNHFHYLGYNIAGPLNDDRVAFSNVLAVNFILIVQRGSTDGYSTHRNRLHEG